MGFFNPSLGNPGRDSRQIKSYSRVRRGPTQNIDAPPEIRKRKNN
jgi:hypothetical protein